MSLATWTAWARNAHSRLTSALIEDLILVSGDLPRPGLTHFDLNISPWGLVLPFWPFGDSWKTYFHFRNRACS
jgi:hypothetical protein